MSILIAGILLWIGVHLIPSAGKSFRLAAIDRLGLFAYRACFAACVLGALTLIVIGWRRAQPISIYLPPPALRPVAIGLAVSAFVLLAATVGPTRIGRRVRFPQLAAVFVWAIAHLLSNGDSRSLATFTGFAAWAAMMMVLISRRDGPRQLPPAPSWTVEILGIAAGLLLAGGAIYLHPLIIGVPVFQPAFLASALQNTGSSLP